MEINKVVFGSDTIMDISDTTASEGDVLATKYFYTAAGVRTAGIAQALTIDSALSTTSENPVQNKVITQKVGLDSLNTVAQDLSGAVNEILGAIPSTAADIGAYALPTTGIPSSDLADTYAGSPSAGGIANKTASIPMGKLDATSTSTVMTATIDGITELRDGVCVWLTNGVVTSASGYTININGLGAKPVYSSQSAASRTTTIFASGYTALLIYNSTRVEGGCWDYVYGYDSNTNTIGYQLRTNSYSLPMTSIVYRYRLLFQSADNAHWVPANSSSSTKATSSKTVCQDKINPFGNIVYYGTTASVSAGSSPAVANLWQQYAFTFGYSFNRTGAALTLTAWKPIYIKCAPQSDGSAIIDSTTPYVQDLPTTEDGKIYIFLGVAYSETAVELTLNHPIYYYKNGRIHLYTDATIPTATEVGAIPAPANPSTGNVLTYRNNAWVSEAPSTGPSLSNDSPAALQAQAAAGSSLKASRADHVHPLPEAIQVTYSELRTKITNEALIPGQFYRITDFVTIINGTYDLTDWLGYTSYLHYARSAGKQFDLIVQAIDEFSLSENATAANHENGSYWVANIGVWDIKYTIYNDTDKFAWADPNGKGVIYYLKDEFGNEAWYDFKNIQFLRYGIEKVDENSSTVSSTLNYDENETSSVGTQINRYGTPYNLLALVDPSSPVEKVYGNYLFTCRDNITSALEYSEVDETYLSTFNADWYYTFDVVNQYGHGDLSLNFYQNICCYNNSIQPCNDLFIEQYNATYSSSGNKLGLGGNVFQNADPDEIGYIADVDMACHDNCITSNSHFNVFGAFCCNNHILNCNGNAFGNFSCGNNLQQQSYLNALEDNNQNNTFTSSNHNEFNINCANNNLISCSVIIFGTYCTYNTLQTAYNNQFGDYNGHNIIGHSFRYSIFGNSCSYNIIGNYCEEFIFGQSCSYNLIGNYNYTITFNDICKNVTIGNGNKHLTLPNYVDGLIVDNDTYGVTLTGNTSNYKWCLGYHIYSEVEEYTAAVVRSRLFETSIGKPTSSAVRSWNIHDAYVKPSTGIPASDLASGILSPSVNTSYISVAEPVVTLDPCPVTYDFGECDELTVTVTATTQYHFSFSCPSGVPTVLTINGATEIKGNTLVAGGSYEVDVWDGVALIVDINGVTSVVTSVNGQTGAVSLSIPSTAAAVGAIPAPATANNDDVLTYDNGGWVAKPPSGPGQWTKLIDWTAEEDVMSTTFTAGDNDEVLADCSELWLLMLVCPQTATENASGIKIAFSGTSAWSGHYWIGNGIKSSVTGSYMYMLHLVKTPMGILCDARNESYNNGSQIATGTFVSRSTVPYATDYSGLTNSSKNVGANLDNLISDKSFEKILVGGYQTVIGTGSQIRVWGR